MVTSLVVETGDLSEAANNVSGVGDRLAEHVATALTTAASCTGMAGDDPHGLSWASGYERIAPAARQAAQDVINATYRYATLLAATATNYAAAESASTAGAQAAVDRAIATLPPQQDIELGMQFTDVGGCSLPPPWGWSYVERAHRALWPNGHQDRLRDAEAAWDRSASALEAEWINVEFAGLGCSIDRLPEAPDIKRVSDSLADDLLTVARVHRGVAQACGDYAHFLDVAHSKLESDLTDLVEQTVGIEVVGGLLAFVTAGTSELVAQGVETWRVAEIIGRIVEVLDEFGTAVAVVLDGMPTVSSLASRVSAGLRDLLSVRIVVVEVTGVGGFRALSIARDGGDATALGRLEVNAAEVADGGGHYVDPPSRVDVADPKTFDPQSVRGMSAKNLRESIPKDWDVRAASRGEGTVYEDPQRSGRQIRIMKPYPPGSRPDPVTTGGPYAVISQNGKPPVKIPLAGNRVLK